MIALGYFLVWAILLVITPIVFVSILVGKAWVFCAKLWRCPCCGRRALTIDRRHRLTAYCKTLDDCNYLISCEACFYRDYQEMSDLWDEYWKSRL